MDRVNFPVSEVSTENRYQAASHQTANSIPGWHLSLTLSPVITSLDGGLQFHTAPDLNSLWAPARADTNA